MMMTKVTSISWDWKSRPSFSDLKEALEPFGIYVHESEMCKGQDAIGFVFSENKLTEDEVYNWEEDNS